MKDLRIGIIGCCGRGTLADNAHKPGEGSVIVAGAEPYPEQRKMFLDRYQEKFGVQPALYADYREMIDKENLDGVIILSLIHISEPTRH